MIYVLSGNPKPAGVIRISYPANSTLVVKGTGSGKQFAKDTNTTSSAKAYIFLAPIGDASYTLTATNTAGKTVSKQVYVAQDQVQSVTLTYFSATIKVTYPAKSKCVIKNSSGTQVASDTNTGTSAKTWTATVGATGTYTITATATDGSGKTKSATVSITADGQVKTVTLAYWDGTIYDAGNEYTAQTGGWTCVTTGGNAIATKTNNELFVSVENTSNTAYARTANKISLTGFTKIQATVSAQTHVSSWGGNERCKLLVSANADLSNPVASVQPTTNNAQTLSLDINLTGTYYVGIKAAAGAESSVSMTVTKIKLA